MRCIGKLKWSLKSVIGKITIEFCYLKISVNNLPEFMLKLLFFVIFLAL